MGATSSALRVAIIGTGMIAELHRRGALLAGAQIVGVLGSSPQRSREFAARWAVPTLDDLDAVLASGADVVHIATPNATHAEYAHAVLAAGKHVVCEKPLGMDVAQAEALDAAAVNAGVVATVPFVYRFHPIVREIRARRAAGEFGNLLLLHGCYLQDWMLAPAVSGWRVDPASGGASRAFADIGSHWCDLTEFVSGERFVELTAQTHIAYPERPRLGGESFSATANLTDDLVTVRTEDSAVVLLRTASGVLATSTVSQVAAGRKNRLWLELDGSSGSAVFDQENPETAWFGGAEENRVMVRNPAAGADAQRRLSKLPAGHGQGYSYCFEAFVADTYSAVAGAEPDGLPRFADGVRAARIVDAVLRSAASRAWEPIA
ncbi:Gfo/Idh/MocA family oxidoreductase [Aldersonia sp. NBC_00410]|uniref:Gfo/Idh/MocA family protein n=1 Tax=Aldersonia sp. NBC_00410 TaxID=2975954 RepID=UPI00225A8BD5|nr:Gfo/Idh/MocA family oxidoreductase [Aldersonia sp. NBC_00410]MCX5042932.1 Gfo/Idh/MocA family oxidoreductase [Aldersonia sp. NBC_00410]